MQADLPATTNEHCLPVTARVSVALAHSPSQNPFPFSHTCGKQFYSSSLMFLERAAGKCYGFLKALTGTASIVCPEYYFIHFSRFVIPHPPSFKGARQKLL